MCLTVFINCVMLFYTCILFRVVTYMTALTQEPPAFWTSYFRIGSVISLELTFVQQEVNFSSK